MRVLISPFSSRYHAGDSDVKPVKQQKQQSILAQFGSRLCPSAREGPCALYTYAQRCHHVLFSPSVGYGGRRNEEPPWWEPRVIKGSFFVSLEKEKSLAQQFAYCQGFLPTNDFLPGSFHFISPNPLQANTTKCLELFEDVDLSLY